MYYQVTAKLKTQNAAELLQKLNDGTIKRQKPDGEEIVDSMNRAARTDSGDIIWSQVCYCSTPLFHERATVYDKYFDNLTTEVIEGYEKYEGSPFMEYLNEIAYNKVA